MSYPVTYQPLTQWPTGRARTPDGDREDARFKQPSRFENAGTAQSRYIAPKPIPLSQTLEDLDRELFAVNPSDVVVQIDVTNKADMRDDIRRDGRIRDDARVHSPAVVLSFKRGNMPLIFACDHFKRWQDNLRAIVLGLEALRKLERYHIMQTGDQYRGWAALPASTTTAFNVEQAAAYLARLSNNGATAADITKDLETARHAYRRAAANTHPDSGGSTGNFQLVQESKRVLGAHFGASL